MAISTGCRKLLCHVIRIGCGIEIVSMTSGTGIWCVVIVTIVAGRTVAGYSRVRTNQLVEVVVYGEGSRCPSCIGGVAGFTTRGQIQRNVAGIDTLCVIIGVATRTGIGRIVIVPLMTLVAGYARVRPCERPVVVVKVGRCPGCLPVTVRTIC